MVFDKRSAAKMYKMARSIAKDKDGEITVLDVVNVPRQTPLSLTHGFGDKGLKAIEEFKREITGSLRNRYLVRLAHDPTEAILQTTEEQDINTLLIDFDFLKNNRKLLSLTTCDIIGVRLRKSFDEDMKNIVVAYDKGRHSDLGLEIANSIQKMEESKIRIIRGVIEDPKQETEIVNRINEKMFELELPKIQFEKVYSDSNIITELLKNFKKEKNALLILGAGNQTDTAFSPKTLSILDKSGKSAIIVRNHRFSEVHARSFANFIMPKIIQVRFIYQIYVNVMQRIYSMRAKSHRERDDDDYFSA
ncbi:MAG: Uncharacterised protein [Candidatus Nitrosopelagicus brevis]|nr:MAG: Uncharacterised protein [Candidatus Nitrosopelagicus brevis]